MKKVSYLEIAQASENMSRELLQSIVCNGDLLQEQAPLEHIGVQLGNIIAR